MVSRAAAPLTKISFRRDIKYFLAVYVGFLVVIILILLLLLQANTVDVSDAMREQWNDTANAASTILSSTAGDIDIAARLPEVRLQYGITAIDYLPLNGRPFRTGNAPGDSVNITRSIPTGKAIFRFDATRLHLVERRFRYTAAISMTATVIGTLLLVAFLPRVVRPIEEMLDDARELGERRAGEDEQSYLIETFRKSIATLKVQEAELKQLHDMEKMRADELELVAATLTRTLTSGFIAVDRESRLVDINAAGREILRLVDKGAVRGLTIEEALGETAFARVLGDAVRRLGTLTRHEVVNEDARVVGLSTVPLLTIAGEHLGMIALFTDLSPIRALEARVRELQTLAELGEISAGIAHEFRNALSTILGYVKLARRVGIAPEADARLRSAEQEAVVLSGAVDGLLSFARPMALDRHRVEIREVVDDVVDRLAVFAGEVRVEVRGDSFAVDGDAALISRAIENVIRNAIESAHEKGVNGEVIVELRSDPPVLEIRDNGSGVDPADIPRLFLPFQSQKSSGLGLGLPLARKVILLHGGSIRLTGTPGAGATLTIELVPSAAEAPA